MIYCLDYFHTIALTSNSERYEWYTVWVPGKTIVSHS